MRSTTTGAFSGPHTTTAAAQPECTRKPSAAACTERSELHRETATPFEKRFATKKLCASNSGRRRRFSNLTDDFPSLRFVGWHHPQPYDSWRLSLAAHADTVFPQAILQQLGQRVVVTAPNSYRSSARIPCVRRRCLLHWLIPEGQSRCFHPHKR